MLFHSIEPCKSHCIFLTISNVFRDILKQSYFLNRSQYVYGERKIARITEDDIKAFRAETYVKSIDELRDLDANADVIEIFDKIKELENSGFDLQNAVPDDGTCSVQVRYFITAIIKRAREQCDFCIQTNVDKENPTIMNVCTVKNWEFFIAFGMSQINLLFCTG